MKTLKEKQLEFFEDTVKYYTENPERFCYDEIRGNCTYSPKSAGKEGKTEGCAIGRHLPTELQEEFDDLEDGKTIDCIFTNEPKLYNKIPDKLKELGVDFLSAVQKWHDTRTYDIEESSVDDLINSIKSGKYL